MPKLEVTFRLSLRDSEELNQLAADCETTPNEFSKQVVENAIADRRLVRITRKERKQNGN